MKQISVKTVSTKQQAKDFVELPHRIYAGNDCYIPDLEGEIRGTIKTTQAFVAYDEQNQCVGRVCAFINAEANKKWQRRAVRFTNIEMENDPAVAKALMDTVEQWGKEQGMNMVLGPLGSYDFDKEGMLVEGFDRPGSMIEIYNPDYYPKLLEELGYEKAVDWVQTRMEIPKEVPKMYARIARYARETFGLHVKKLKNSDIIKGGYARRIFDLLNKAYSPLFGFTAMPIEQIEKYVAEYIWLIDKRLVPVVEDEKGNIVGVAITMGSLNNALRRCNGKLLPTGWWHLLRSLKWAREDTVQLLLIAVDPEKQGFGVSAMFFDDLIPIYNQLGFRWAETGPQLEDNVKELSQWKPMNPEIVKRRRCYQKKLDL